MISGKGRYRKRLGFCHSAKGLPPWVVDGRKFQPIGSGLGFTV